MNFRQMPAVKIPAEIAAMSDRDLEIELRRVSDNLESGADHVAEIEGEFAAYGDGPPGSQQVLTAYYADVARQRALQAERRHRHPPVVAVTDDKNIPPF